MSGVAVSQEISEDYKSATLDVSAQFNELASFIKGARAEVYLNDELQFTITFNIWNNSHS